MSSEDQELLARISQLAGHINRHKNQQASITSGPPASLSSSYRAHVPPAVYSQPYRRPTYPQRGGGYRIAKPAPYRHRTLILNGSNASNSGQQTDSGGGDSSNSSDAGSSAAKKDDGKTSWVARRDRHMQLINSNVYEKEAQARAKAIEQTRLQKQKIKDERERAKLRNHFSYLASGRGLTDGVNGTGNGHVANAYQITIQGIRFSVAKNGSKLVKLPGDPNPPSSTPKVAIVGGVKFYRSKNGNLYRHGVVKAQRRAGTVKKIDQLCRIFSTTGSCAKGPLCRYIHDPAKVAVCKEFLQKGDCPNGSDCDLSHELTAGRTPFCLHFAKGNCTNPYCPYTHSEVSAGAPVCRPFGIYGYCDKGADCTERHVFECPDFSNTGVCKTKGCKLPHRERASFMRRANNNAGDTASDAEDADLVDYSSDESVNSDDVDSDEVDEFVGADSDDADVDFVTQKDFIEF